MNITLEKIAKTHFNAAELDQIISEAEHMSCNNEVEKHMEIGNKTVCFIKENGTITIYEMRERLRDSEKRIRFMNKRK